MKRHRRIDRPNSERREHAVGIYAKHQARVVIERIHDREVDHEPVPESQRTSRCEELLQLVDARGVHPARSEQFANLLDSLRASAYAGKPAKGAASVLGHFEGLHKFIEVDEVGPVYAAQHCRTVVLLKAACIEEFFHGADAAAGNTPFRHARGIEGFGGERYDLDVGRSPGIADELGTKLGELPGTSHELSLLAHDRGSIAQPERSGRMLETRRGKTGDWHGQVASHHKKPAVRVKELKRSVVDAGGAFERTPASRRGVSTGRYP